MTTPDQTRNLADELEATHHAGRQLRPLAVVDDDTVALVPPPRWQFAALLRGDCVVLGRREGRVMWTVVARAGRLVWAGPVEVDR